VEEIKLWRVVNEGCGKPVAMPVPAIAATSTEQLLEETLTKSPELLIPGLHLVGRQTETDGGPLDLLGVDDDGRLVVFELKRGSLTREAVAQAIDYGSFLDGLESDDLCHHISENSGKGGTEPIEDFAQWYQSQFQRSVAEIGHPRIVLVGLGVDERAKRMVAFLAQCELDISLITFHGFKQGSETLLARQVEVQAQPAGGTVKSTKIGNQAKLEKLIATLGVKQKYDTLVGALREGLGPSAYQWPNSTGYSFYLREVSATGGPTNRAYIALYTPEQRKGDIQVFLQPRAIKAAGTQKIQALAGSFGSKPIQRSDGCAEIWLDRQKMDTNCAESLKSLGQAITAGWKTSMENQANDEAVEANTSANASEPPLVAESA
jgi:hypothetical protein